MASQAYDPLQEGDETSLLDDNEIKCTRCRKRTHKERIIDVMILVNMVLFLLAISLLLGISSTGQYVLLRNAEAILPDAVDSPGRVAEGFQAVTFDAALNATNRWKGPPSDALDEAWEDTFHVGPMAVTAEELQKIGKTSVAIPSRPGKYLAKLAVFHQLHCLDRIRRYVHNDYYHMDDSHSSVSTIDHIDHCIDIVRQVITCKADTTLITFKPQGLLSVDPDFEATHACANFDRVHDWARAREINVTKEIEEHPEAFRRAMFQALREKLAKNKTEEV